MKTSPEKHHWNLQDLLTNFQRELKSEDLRQKVLALVPCFIELRKLGKSLVSFSTAKSARERILHYLIKYPRIVISGDELLVVSGIQEYARRIRELRVQFGWSIVSGITANLMAQENEFSLEGVNPATMSPSDYLLITPIQDRGAAHRWNSANEIRRESSSVKDKILKYFQANVGEKITGEELKYLAKDRSEWARRVRELRTESGWPIVTRNTGRPDLDVGVYLLEADRQSPEHDRRIPDPVKAAVLQRDGVKCTMCGWTHEGWTRSDPRHLELHHVTQHAQGGKNTIDNLTTLCTICHDQVHRRR